MSAPRTLSLSGNDSLSFLKTLAYFKFDLTQKSILDLKDIRFTTPVIMLLASVAEKFGHEIVLPIRHDPRSYLGYMLHPYSAMIQNIYPYVGGVTQTIQPA